MLTVNKIKSKNVKEFICGAKIEKKILTKQVKVAPPEPIKQEKQNVINFSLKKTSYNCPGTYKTSQSGFPGTYKARKTKHY